MARKAATTTKTASTKTRSTASKRTKSASAKAPKSKISSTSKAATATAAPASGLSTGEEKVLKIFRQYLMTPGQMLCLSNVGIDSMQLILSSMTESGLIVPDDFKGAYSLTRTGYEAMNRIA